MANSHSIVPNRERYGVFYGLADTRSRMTYEGGSGSRPASAECDALRLHFRNVSAPLPHFSETLIDDGYYDMSKVMRALVEVKFEVIVIPEHIPAVGVTPDAPDTTRGAARAGEYRPSPGLAYLIGCMNAMLKSAQST